MARQITKSISEIAVIILVIAAIWYVFKILTFGSLSESDTKFWGDVSNVLLIVSAVLVATGLIGEWPESHSWKRRSLYKAAKYAVVIGVAGELLADAGVFKAGDRLQEIDGTAIVAANKRAADAQEALLKYREPRSRELARHKQAVIDALSHFPNTRFDTGLDHQSGEEADFLRALSATLKTAGWQHIPWDIGGTWPWLLLNVQTDFPLSAPIAAINVEIHVHADERTTLNPAASALIKALNDAGISCTDAGDQAQSINKNTIHIWIGEKR